MFIKIIHTTMSEMLPILTLFLVAYVTVKFFEFKSSRRKFYFKEEILNLVFLLYILVLFSFLSKTDINLTSGYNLKLFQEIFRHPFGSELFAFNVLGNIIAFVPLGIIVSLKLRGKSFGKVFLTALIISFSTEIIQLYIERAFDIDDIILNVLGASIGFLIVRAFSFLVERIPFVFNKKNLINFLLFIILVALTIYILKTSGVINFNIWTLK